MPGRTKNRTPAATLRASPASDYFAVSGFADLIEAFDNFMGLERGLSLHTRENYQRDLKQAAEFFSSQKLASWVEVNPPLAAKWIRALASEGYSVASVARKLTALRVFARFLVKEGIRDDDLAALIVGPKLVRRVPVSLSADQVQRLLKAPQGGDAATLRDRAILELFYSSGLRVSELGGTTLQQVDLPQRFIRIFGKGSKERLVPLGIEACEAIRIWLAAGRQRMLTPRSGGSLFLNRHGTSLSRVALWSIIKKHAARAGMRANVKPHSLRHSFATHLLAGGADLRSIQEMLGHASIATTQIYTAVEPARILSHHSKFHPRSTS